MDKISKKLMIICAMALGLLLPAMAVHYLTVERSQRRDMVLEEAKAVWGNARLLSAPYFKYGSKKITAGTVTFKGNVEAVNRKRGIFRVPFYRTNLEIEGTIRIPFPTKFRSDLFFLLSDGKAEDVSGATWNGRAVAVRETSEGRFLYIPLHKPLKPGVYPFRIKLNFTGTRQIRFLPTAKKTVVELTSNWGDPSFSGLALPIERDVSSDGFTARWEVRGGSKYIRSLDKGFTELMQDGFGVELFIPVDIYHQMERSLKYSILFIGLTFMTFFLFEMFYSIRVHPLQYLLIGFGLCLFYLLLLSFAEQIGFSAAYFISALTIIAVNTTYSNSVLKTGRRAWVMAGLMSGLYIFLYVVLMLADFALLMGSLGLLFILCSVMYVTRNFDWYGKENQPA